MDILGTSLMMIGMKVRLTWKKYLYGLINALPFLSFGKVNRRTRAIIQLLLMIDSAEEENAIYITVSPFLVRQTGNSVCK
jgi:hypothetical protein